MNTIELPFSPASERNKHPIFEVLDRVLPENALVLEIGSGTGQHVVWFAGKSPQRTWQPSDRDDYLAGLKLRLAQEGGDNVYPVLELDVLKTWPSSVFDAVYSANTAHIMSWEAVCAMFKGVTNHLEPSGVFCLYGPFNQGGEFTSASNAAFDAQLKMQNPEMGIRDLEALETLANDQQLYLRNRFPMPANNQLLVFAKADAPTTA